ncbi:RagB/SusD family nutrient uptake outer membrane protein [Hymenobacter edaphi]|uniref:RagB/SusD family nutrient uptake outer membrane protein n=1 Tax=Hymenobacter edaphi TaxID=2211146 RepID=A0A328BQG7_9BACT|nr:RagB/SusD family nutrient uptake outer membrane protein [Hymenobacter edaphi]RAK69317.1 RagB/SusD family nutrient uptake outer membrane protein [Hymenobacter edaphi]
MKKLVIPVLALALLASGCNVLDKEPLTTLAPSNFFKTAEDAEASLAAVYDGLQAKGCYAEVLMLMGTMPTDDGASANNDVAVLRTINWNSSTGQVYDMYRDAYQVVNRANAVIKYVPGISGMSSGRRDQIIGEAKFLRALAYFNLVRLYGGVPLRLEPTESGDPAILNLPRAAADEVYNLIVSDLTAAAGAAPASNPTRVTRGAANALLARVQLTRRDWAAAKTAAGNVLGGQGGYTLAPSFNALFPADNRGESIFEIQFSGNTDAGTFHTLPDVVMPSPPATYAFPKFNRPSANLLQAADTVNDLRWSFQGNTSAGRNFASFVRRPGGGDNGGDFCYKWRSDGNNFNSPDNSYLLRLADVLLMYAEASNEQGGPSQDVLDKLNPVRQRAGLAPLTMSSPQLASKQALRRQIELQRRLELAFEGERWFDLVRYARHEQADPSADHAWTALDQIQQQRNGRRDENYLQLPIPLSELNTNTQIQQNPGY